MYFDLETLSIDDVKAVVDLAWKRWGGIVRASSDLETSEYVIREWLREQPRTWPSGHQWLQMVEAAADEIVERIIFDLGEIGVGVRSVVLLVYPTDEDLRALTEDKWSAQVQTMVMQEAADALQSREIEVAVLSIDNAGYRSWCRENNIDEDDNICARTTYALSRAKKGE